MEPNLAGSIYVRSPIKLLHLVPFGQHIWPPRAILFFWLANAKQIFSSETARQMEPNLTGSIYVRSSIKCLRFVPLGKQMWLPRANLVTVQWPSNLYRIFMSRSVSQLLLEIDHLYLFYKYFVRCTCQSARCHLTLTSFSRSSDLHHIFMSRSVSQLL